MFTTIRNRAARLLVGACTLWLIVFLPGEAFAQTGNPPTDETSPAAVAEPSPSPEPLPAADAAGVERTQADGASGAPSSSQLFQSAPSEEPDPAVEAEKRRAAVLLNAQNAQATADAFSRSTFGRAETNAETLFNGIGGVPLALNPLYVAPGSKEPSGFHLGPFTIHPILSAGVGYGTASGNGNSSSDGFYGSLSPAFTLTLGEPATGKIVSVEYTGSLTYGANSVGRQLYNQSFSANGTLNFVKLNLGFGLDFSQLSGSDRDFGGRDVNREIVGLSFNASYIYSEKTNFTASLTAPIRLFGQGSNSEGVNGTGFINYVYSPLTTIGVGVGLGTLEVEQGQSQVFEQVLTRLTYVISERFTFNGTAGYEFRDAGSKEQITPIFGLGLAWNVREGTTVSLSGERRIENSAAMTDTNYTDTSVSVSLSQRLGDSLQFTGTIGYENANYSGISSGVSDDRRDNQLILQGALSYHFKDRWIATGIISYGKDFSNRDAFDSLQNSLQLSYVF